MKKYQLEDRIVEFSISIIEVAKTFEKTEVGIYLQNQIIRSALSSALNYGEAKGAESRRDFIHKLKLSLKELHETSMNLRIIAGSNLSKRSQRIGSAQKECKELIAMTTQSILTAQKNSKQIR